MAAGLDDAFSDCGSGYSYTYRGFFNMLRIDFVLTSPEFRAVVYEVPSVIFLRGCTMFSGRRILLSSSSSMSLCSSTRS